VVGEEIAIQRGDDTPGAIRISSGPIKDGRGRMHHRWRRDLLRHRRAEAVENALQFLAEASEVLSSSLHYETTLISVARLAVPWLGDWCAADVVREDGEIQRLVVAHVDPAKIELAFELEHRSTPNPIEGEPLVLRTDEPLFYPDIPDELLVETIHDPERLPLLRSLGLRWPPIADGRAAHRARAHSSEHSTTP
jgi:hypothetical protein